MEIDRAAIREILNTARATGRTALLETEGLELLRALGVSAPAWFFVRDAAEASQIHLDLLTGERVVVKVVSPEILHKSDVGGVTIVAKNTEGIGAAIAQMQERLADQQVQGFLLCECVPFNSALGNELLFGMRWTADFGPVVTFGPGGIYTEFLAKSFAPGKDTAVLSPLLASAAHIERVLDDKAITSLITGKLRGQKARVAPAVIVELLQKFLAFASAYGGEQVAEFECNPVVISNGQLKALDVRLILGKPGAAATPARPVDKIKNLLEPKSAAIIGVSEKINPGHIILNNLLREGFDPGHIYVVKPGKAEFKGCRCVADIAALPERVDLFILSIDAAQTPAAIDQIVEQRKAESLIVIPGGLGERSGSEGLVAKMEQAIHASRATDWRGPVINGGNCLGIRSKPGRYDTMFIPEYKLPPTTGAVSPLCLLSQSGALAVARASKLASLNPRYIISIGNQLDLTVGDYLGYFAADPEIDVYACYVEGFKPGDGAKWLQAAAGIVKRGKNVILYRAGRTVAGMQASASHTASIAGDYAVTRELCQQVGVVVADSLADFEDLARMFCLMRGKRVNGWRLGALSNAGFECVAIADNAKQLKLSPFAEATQKKLE